VYLNKPKVLRVSIPASPAPLPDPIYAESVLLAGIGPGLTAAELQEVLELAEPLRKFRMAKNKTVPDRIAIVWFQQKESVARCVAVATCLLGVDVLKAFQMNIAAFMEVLWAGDHNRMWPERPNEDCKREFAPIDDFSTDG
jgi:hypothetical protein